MPAPHAPPIGLQLARTAKSVNRAFQDALAAGGGSLPRWLILISLKAGRPASQRELAEAIGIRGATLTHHLDAMEADGLVIRSSDPANRRVQRVELTEAGDAAFHRMRHVAATFDQRLRAGLNSEQVDNLSVLLRHLRHNIEDA